MHENEVATAVVDSSFRIHCALGPGLLESVYVAVLAHELVRRRKQLLTDLRLADKRLGLLINFHVCLIKDGIHRIVNGLTEPS